ncbi:Guanine nucleotide-binding protein-like 1 [Zancudomyces culisetae]|uniref:Guanine nucleotide-binding protein-like 1 n=1 Tax=Zancudomyces culisetae TaxID=1213189 RepID=A0A1R1PSU9_ZANCU|nr:Guanine nucleotide-binding protein-like 1 [Zancudomyces culisetae]|eukprot:OMH83962.1 Guanine nucleotide-binding protein-like 1 [Zancudomyces culisetae]
MTSVGESENERNNRENVVLSAWNITEQYATMRRYFTARNPRPDSYRAGIEILKLVFDGRLLLSFKPPGFYTGIGSGGDDQGLYKRGTDKNQDKTASTTAVLNSTAQANISDNIDFVDQRLRSVNIYDIMRVEDVDGNESGDSNNVSNDDYISHPPDTKPKDEGNITPGEKNTKNKSESKRSGKKTSGFVSNKFELLNS